MNKAAEKTQEAVERLKGRGVHEDDAIALIAHILDGILPFDVLIPNPIGQTLETMDRAIITQILNRIADWILDRNKQDELARSIDRTKRLRESLSDRITIEDT